MHEKPKVMLGLLGPVLDAGRGSERWERWRPTVAVCQHEDLLISRFELLYEPKFTRLCDQVTAVRLFPHRRCHGLEIGISVGFGEL
jgi:transcriptional regulatory protein RtcR